MRPEPYKRYLVMVFVVLVVVTTLTALALRRGPPRAAPDVTSVAGPAVPSIVDSRPGPASLTAASPSRRPAVASSRPTARLPSPSPRSPSPVWTTLTVTATTSLFRGQSVHTNRTTLELGDDGDLVIIDETGRVRWSAHTAPAGSRATFQDDGNFVVYDPRNRPLWSSNTSGHPGAVLVLPANGDVCVQDGGAPLWCAGTAH